MGTSVVVAAIALATVGQTMSPQDVKTQNEVFQQLWGTPFSWKFDDLPANGGVEDFRVPYSGHIYPDTQGGTMEAMRKYDRAFHRGRSLATAYERHDTTAFKERPEFRGLFGRTFSIGAARTPNWHGHCNGWSAAAIRHAEPQKSVYRNGVEFDTADIKALLAELYIYNDTAMLAGDGTNVNPGILHAILANWIGRGSHPIGVETDPGEEKWNYPAYAYASASAKRGRNQVEVKTNVAYAKDSDGEYYESPRIKRVKYFHYMLNLNNAGQITGGYYLRDSSIIDMVWVPLAPKQGGTPGNERGNPHINVDTVLAIWRESVGEELRKKWYTVDPAPLDRIANVEALANNDDSADDEEETVETGLNASDDATEPAEVESNTEPAAESSEEASSDDAANGGPVTSVSTRNTDVAPVVVHVEADPVPTISN